MSFSDFAQNGSSGTSGFRGSMGTTDQRTRGTASSSNYGQAQGSGFSAPLFETSSGTAAQRKTGKSGQEDTKAVKAYEHSMAELSSKIRDYHQQMLIVEKLASALTPRATDREKDVIQRELQKTSQLQGEIATQLSRPPPDHYRAQHKKASKDFEQIVMRFHQIWISVDRLLRGGHDDDGEDQRQQEEPINLQEIQFRKLDNEIALNESLIAEREKEVQEIHKSVVEVNEIFKDLASLVHQQQEHIDLIEENARVARDNVSKGVDEIKQAAANQSTCSIQ